MSNPSILVLDEATSSVDGETEELIQIATDRLTEGKTAIIIAHRLATVQKADRIIVMDNGKIVEIGSHEKLLQIERWVLSKSTQCAVTSKTRNDLA